MKPRIEECFHCGREFEWQFNRHIVYVDDPNGWYRNIKTNKLQSKELWCLDCKDAHGLHQTDSGLQGTERTNNLHGKNRVSGSSSIH